MKCKVQEMMIESNANEEAIDKWTAEPDEKLEKLEQPMADIEKVIKNWDRRKSIEEKKTRKTKIREKNSRRKTNRGDETGASNAGKKGKYNNKDPKGKLLKLVISQFSVHTYRFWNQFETQIDKSELSSVVHNLGVLAHFSSWGTFEIESKIRQEKIVKIHKGFE